MADIYVRSTDGSNADNGSTWALAKATLAGAAAIDAAGDTIYVSDNHAESSASAQTIALAGTLASPVRVLCVDDTGDPSPPTALATTGTVSTTGANAISVTGNAYIYGLTFNAGSGNSNSPLNIGANSNFLMLQRCGLEIGSTAASSMYIGVSNYSGDQRVELKDCTIKFGSTAQTAFLFGRVRISGGSIGSGSSTPSSGVFNLGASGEAANVLIEGFDFSNLSSTVHIFTGVNVASPAHAIVRNCKLPDSWTGQLRQTSIGASMTRLSMYNCDSADTNYRLWIETYAGSITSETTIVRTGGASDGTTGLSWKLTTSANAEYPLIALETDEIVRWNETTGSSITATIEVITDNVTLKDDECWLEVQYLGTSGRPLSLFASDAKADVLATAANQTNSSETWTTTGLTTPVKQKLSVSFTPQEKGFIHAVVKLAKASATVYVDPVLTVT